MLEDYGFHIIPLSTDRAPRVRVKGRNLLWALVGITADGKSVYGEPLSSRLPVQAGQLDRLFLVVMGAPDSHRQLYRHRGETPVADDALRTYPYQFKYE